MSQTLLTALVIAPPLLIAVILHEIAHGLVAGKLGDPTAREAGRLTLNPLKHIDPFMTVLVPAMLVFAGSPVIFGGAKPVPINALYFENPRKGMGWVAIAGPATNFILAAISYWLFLLARSFAEANSPNLVLQSLAYSVLINLTLGIFNLVPIPPLDGGRIATALLPRNLARQLARLEPVGLILVFLLLLSGAFNDVLGPILEAVLRLLR